MLLGQLDVPLHPAHATVVRIASALREVRTVALAGGGAMLAHGLVDRVTRDVDLFTDRDADEAVAVASALRETLAQQGWDIQRSARPPYENRFVAVDPATRTSVQIEVFADGGRLREPVRLEVGPVLHVDDLAADKVLALWARGEPRDFVDVVALLEVFPGRRLLDLAAQKDRGFTDGSFVEALAGVRRIVPARWAAAGVDVREAAHLTEVVDQWRESLDKDAAPPKR